MRKEPWEKRAQQYRDIGIYTAIPMMMVVGPVLGYFLGRFAEKKWGHEPYLAGGGALLGLLAAARQVWLILQRGGGKR